ncbi:galactosyl transferase [Diplodia corticola]|uniref:Galactosyl transferase n=1 Tax=Diplodia corticola TaxID=236234 RepID=A0A1J9QTS6_9PEZI|nr:galactosyl transferase [Diplodia corticola]OJD31801.1 galactosyl transferase [Diplodia corticola]
MKRFCDQLRLAMFSVTACFPKNALWIMPTLVTESRNTLSARELAGDPLRAQRVQAQPISNQPPPPLQPRPLTTQTNIGLCKHCSDLTMLPPIAPAVLERNPKFKALHEDISQNKLNPDASTKDVKKQRLVDEARNELNIKRTDLAKKRILKTSLGNLSARSANLPDELHEVITIVAAQLNGQIPSCDREILQEDVDYFTAHITPISRALSTHLHRTALQLCRIATTTTSQQQQQQQQNPTAQLPPTAQHHQSDLAAATASLAAHRTALADAAAATRAAQTRVVEAAVRVLEQTVHGSAARAARARAEHLAAVARGVELKMGVVALTASVSRDGGGGELERAVEGYARWLREEGEELGHRRAIAEDRLRGFEGEEAAGGGGGGGGGGGLLREIARRYAEVEEEIARVAGEVERLERERGL